MITFPELSLKAMQSPCLKKLLLLKNFRTARFHVAVHDTACSAMSFVVLNQVTSVAVRKPIPIYTHTLRKTPTLA
ncbi:hypothetical protein NC651_024968 [Populus alba x Populus x berolinensis]|nr:hypothetical protein NC651_024960 [Populus alba x Populus x berolinensis]KAJ6891618.1 hypothetical protein NC651_024962 [Populus alba x Populus x berolinensis]KAJ6891629.1 hypothetical protein NC651_024968 [Populus alba x Populus x berolinensis]